MKLNSKQFFITAWALMCVSCFSMAANNPPPADEAMKVSYEVINDEMVTVKFDLIQGVYLYKHAFGFKGEEMVVEESLLNIPKGKEKDDPAFGLVEVYYDGVSIDVPISSIGGSPKLQVKYQGCVENFICYPPQRKTFDLTGQVKASNVDSAISDSISGGLLGSSTTGSSFFGGEALLPVDQAFQFETIALDANQLMARFTMAPNIYLYKDQIQWTSFTEGVNLGEPIYPQAQRKDDPEFGLVDVYYDVVEIEIPYSRSVAGITQLQLEAAFQGCEDGKVCYPPTAQLVNIDLPEAEQLVIVEPSTAPEKTKSAKKLSETGEIIKGIGDDPLWWTLLKFFGWGLLLSFTPCVFPMIPILSGLIVGQKNLSTARAFSLSLVYVLAMALTYTLVGVVAGLAGTNLQAMFQTPWIIISFSVVFVLLALSMFGFYDLQLPTSWQNKLTSISNRQKGGSLKGVAVMGFLSALIVGPCAAPPLAAAVVYISSADGGPVLGGITLFTMSMGMGLPLLIIGSSAGKWMPHAGGWMNVVKSFFGVLLLGMAIWFLSRVIPDDVILMMWGLLLIATAIMWHQNAKDNGLSGWVMSLFDALKVILLVIGVAQLVGAMAGKGDPIRPLKGVFSGGAVAAVEKVDFIKIKSLAQLNEQIASSTKPVFFDFYADWCPECIRMEKTTFVNPEFIKTSKQFTMIKADVTKQDDLDVELMNHFGVYAPPASLFFAKGGEPLVEFNFFGYKSADELKQTFEKILN
jgi:thiol:disulfide interchange protein DsbD